MRFRNTIALRARLRPLIPVLVTVLSACLFAACPTSGGDDDSGNTTSVAVTGVTLDVSALGLKTSTSGLLSATVTPADASNKAVTWTSSGTAAATVGADGRVSAKAVGTATITVTTADGGFTASCAVTVTDPDVYIAGSVTDGTNTLYGYWKNGAWNPVSGIVPDAIAVEGGSVYLGGRSSADENVPAYWKDGVKTDLSRLGTGTEWGAVSDIAVTDGAVLMTGNTTLSGRAYSAAWIGTTRYDLSTVGTVESECSHIHASDGAIYVAGKQKNFIAATRPSYGYWKSANGGVSWTWTELAVQNTPSSYDWNTYGGVFADGTDVYAGGKEENEGTGENKAVYWKNGEAVVIHSSSFTDSYCRAVLVHQGTVYAGADIAYASSPGTVGIYNGAAGEWTVIPTDVYGYTVNGISWGAFGVSGSDVFLAANIEDDSSNDHPSFWRNGTKIDLDLPAGYSYGSVLDLCLGY